MTNSADPDKLTSSEANRSGSTLFAMIGHVVFSKRRVKAQSKIVSDNLLNCFLLFFLVFAFLLLFFFSEKVRLVFCVNCLLDR